MLKRSPPLGLVVAGVLALTGSARAQRPDQAAALRDACRSDYRTYCSNVTPGGGAGLACLKEHAASLSPTCGTALGGPIGATGGAAGAAESSVPPVVSPTPAMPPAGRRQAGGGACGADYRRFCSGVQAGGGRILACLNEHRQELSPGCGEALATMGAR